MNIQASAPILEADHLRKHFPVRQFRPLAKPQAVQAVEDISLALSAGHAMALVGESGSGKTTVARMLARLYQPTSGEIRFRGAPVASTNGLPYMPIAITSRWSFKIHSPRSIQSIPSAITSDAPCDSMAGRILNRRKSAQILALLNKVSLTPAEQFIEKYPHELSGGQRQRISIARALAVGPEVLLADEPVSMLDVSIRLGVLNLLLRLKQEEQLAVLFITHDIASARYFAEETLVMYAGQSVEGGPSDAVIQQPQHPYTQLLISAASDPDRPSSAKPLPARGEIPSLITPPSGCRFHPRCPHTMPVCRERFPGRTDLGGGHWTNCFLYGEGTVSSAPTNQSTTNSSRGAES